MEEELEKGLELGTEKRITKIVQRLREETGLPALYYDTSNLSDKLNVTSRPMIEIIEELEEKGYEASRSHYSGEGLRTTAPIEVLKNVLKASKN